MEKRNKKHYVAPSMKVYETEPTQILTGSTENVPTNTSVNEWNNGGSLGSYDCD